MKIVERFTDKERSVEEYTFDVLSEANCGYGELEGLKANLNNSIRVLSKLIGVLTDRHALTPDELRSIVGDDEYMTIIEEA